MERRRVVIDTNVLVAGLRSQRGASHHLLRLVGTGRFDLCLSIPLLYEYEDVLARESIPIDSDAARRVLDYFCRVAIAQEIHFLWRPTLRDPKDDLVLELAVAARSPQIITYNLKDFMGSEKFGVKAILPADYLTEIGEIS